MSHFSATLCHAALLDAPIPASQISCHPQYFQRSDVKPVYNWMFRDLESPSYVVLYLQAELEALRALLASKPSREELRTVAANADASIKQLGSQSSIKGVAAGAGGANAVAAAGPRAEEIVAGMASCEELAAVSHQVGVPLCQCLHVRISFA